MSLERVRRFFAAKAPGVPIIEAPASSATVEPAARAHSVGPGQIAKTLSLRDFDEVLPTAGDIHTAVRISPLRMAELVDARWVDVARST